MLWEFSETRVESVSRRESKETWFGFPTTSFCLSGAGISSLMAQSLKCVGKHFKTMLSQDHVQKLSINFMAAWASLLQPKIHSPRPEHLPIWTLFYLCLTTDHFIQKIQELQKNNPQILEGLGLSEQKCLKVGGTECRGTWSCSWR